MTIAIVCKQITLTHKHCMILANASQKFGQIRVKQQLWQQKQIGDTLSGTPFMSSFACITQVYICHSHIHCLAYVYIILCSFLLFCHIRKCTQFVHTSSTFLLFKGWTPLYIASCYGKLEVVQELLQRKDIKIHQHNKWVK